MGYPLLVISLVSISVISFGLWVHHMFTTGLPTLGLSVFTVASMVISIPSGIQIFSALATLWEGKLNIKTSLLYVLGFIFTFVIGGISGVMVASAPFDLQAQDSYFVVAHLHYVLIGGAVFPLLGAIYYWFPKMTGRLMSERMGRWNFWLTMIGFNVAFFPMHLSGLYGMPRRVYTYQPRLGWDMFNFISTVGTLILAAGVLLFVINVLKSLWRGERAGDNPWGGGSLEWATTSPPQSYNFATLPVVHSRYPMWDTPDLADDYVFQENLDRRETLGTTALDAEPEMRVILPSNTILPFGLALAVTFGLVSTLFNIVPLLIWMLIALGLLAVWHWPKGREKDMGWVKAGPAGALQVSTVVKGKGKHPPFYYGVLLFITIESLEFLALMASYFYLRSSTNDWPPGAVPRPELLLPIIGTVLLLASIIPTYLGDHAIKKGDQRGLIRHLWLTMFLEAGFILFIGLHLRSLNWNWDKNAYTSIYWVLILTHLVFALVMILENAFVLVQARQGFYNEERHWGVEADGFSSFFVIAAWVAIFLTVFLSPYLI